MKGPERSVIVSTGDKFGQWTVIGEVAPIIYYRKGGKKKGKRDVRRRVKCRCVCGAVKELDVLYLNCKRTREGGCNIRCRRCASKIIGNKCRRYNLKPQYKGWRVLYRYKMKGKGLMVECECKCGFRKWIQPGVLRLGRASVCHKCWIKDNLTKTTVETVRKVKGLLASGMRQCDISRMLGIKNYIVGSIKRGNSWKHI